MELDEIQKQYMARYLDANGRLIVDENTPPELVEAFNTLNANDVNILEYKKYKNSFINLNSMKFIDKLPILEIQSIFYEFINEPLNLVNVWKSNESYLNDVNENYFVQGFLDDEPDLSSGYVGNVEPVASQSINNDDSVKIEEKDIDLSDLSDMFN